jgi:hypothetical protein
MKYEQPYGVADPNAPYINGNPATGTEGSIPSAAVFQNPQTEIVNLIAAGGLVPTDSDLYQLLESVRSQFVNYAVDTGSVNALSIAYTPALLVRKLGQPYRVKVLNANTGACTMNDGLGVAPIKLSGGADLAANELVAGMIAEFVWDGTNFQLVNSTVGGGSPGTVNNYYIEIPYVADTSVTPNLITAPFSPAITAPTDGNPILVKIANANSGATQIGVNALALSNVVNRDGTPLTIGALVAGQMALLIRSGSTWQLYGSVGSSSVSGGGGGIAGYSGLTGSAPGSTKTASWAVSEIVVENTLGGTTFKGASLSLAFNGATTGANGMDIGATPNQADLSIYAIYNSTSNTWATLGCLGSTSNGKIYGGTHMPAGYVASVLIWSGKCDINGNILQFNQLNSKISIAPVSVFGWNGSAPAIGVVGNTPNTQLASFNGGSGTTVYVNMSLSVAVPANATMASGVGFTAASGAAGPTDWIAVASQPSPAPGLFQSLALPGIGAAAGAGVVTFTDLQLVNPQTLSWIGSYGDQCGFFVSAYRI